MDNQNPSSNEFSRRDVIMGMAALLAAASVPALLAGCGGGGGGGVTGINNNPNQPNQPPANYSLPIDGGALAVNTYDYYNQGDPAGIHDAIAKAGSLGFKRIRLVLHWDDVTNSADGTNYSLANFAAQLQEVVQAGLEPNIVFTTTKSKGDDSLFANGINPWPQTDAQIVKYAADYVYVVQNLQSYLGNQYKFSIGFEPNGALAPNDTAGAKTYAKLFVAVGEAINASNLPLGYLQGPSVTLFQGRERTMTATDFNNIFNKAQIKLANGALAIAANYTDEDALDGYNPSNSIKDSAEGTPEENIQNVLNVMKQSGGKPMVMTEVGWTTYNGVNGVTEQRQAIMTIRSILTYLSLQEPSTRATLKTITIYELRDRLGQFPPNADSPEQLEFGLYNQDWSPKLAATVLANFQSQFAGYSVGANTLVHPDRNAKHWEVQLYNPSNSQSIYARWTSDDNELTNSAYPQAPVFGTKDAKGNFTPLAQQPFPLADFPNSVARPAARAMSRGHGRTSAKDHAKTALAHPPKPLGLQLAA